MATKDITDKMVCLAYAEMRQQLERIRNHPTIVDRLEYPYEILERTTGQPQKVCYRAMERAADRDYIEYGVSLRSGWLTEKGKALLADQG